MKHIWKIKGLLLPKRRNKWWNRKRSFFKNHRNCSLRTSMKGRLFKTFNSYSFNFIGGLCNRRTGYYLCRALWPGDKQFLWFFLSDLLRFHPILLFWLDQTLFFWDVLGKECCSKAASKYSFWCFGFQWVSLWRSDKFLLTLSVFPTDPSLSILGTSSGRVNTIKPSRDDMSARLLHSRWWQSMDGSVNTNCDKHYRNLLYRRKQVLLETHVTIDTWIHSCKLTTLVKW